MKRTASQQALKTVLVLLSMTAAYGGLYLNQRFLLSDRRPTTSADPGTDMMVALSRVAEAFLRERTASMDAERRRLLAMLASDPLRADRTALERSIAELAAEQARVASELTRSESQRAAAERMAAEQEGDPKPLVVLAAPSLPAASDGPDLSEALRRSEEEKERLARELKEVSREMVRARARMGELTAVLENERRTASAALAREQAAAARLSSEMGELTAVLENERRTASAALAREQAAAARLSSDMERITAELAAATNRANALAVRFTAAQIELTTVYVKARINGVFFGTGADLHIGINPSRSAEIYSRGAYNVYPPGDSTTEVRSKILIYEENGIPAYRIFPGYRPPQKGDWF